MDGTVVHFPALKALHYVLDENGIPQPHEFRRYLATFEDRKGKYHLKLHFSDDSEDDLASHGDEPKEEYVGAWNCILANKK